MFKNEIQFVPLGIVVIVEMVIWVWKTKPGGPLPMNLVLPFIVAIAVAVLLGIFLDYLIRRWQH